jgi:23S rRNA (guanine2445-N2)-methyltransferase / 23S rRNA (guanine2069-N7)-methyltransferase
MSTLSFFATCPKGLELLLKDELLALGADEAHEKLAGVAFSAEPVIAEKIILWTRLANRILLPVAEFPLREADDLYRQLLNVDWNQVIQGEPQTLWINFTGTNAAIRNSQFGAQLAKDALVDWFTQHKGYRPNVDKNNPDLLFSARLHHNTLTFSLDLSGRSLHLRGYRQKATIAPLKENLAAAILYRGDWPAKAANNENLVDPMCGSGTFLTEGWLMACDVAPGLLNPAFGFDFWAKHDAGLWQALLEEARQRQATGMENFSGQIVGNDNHAESLAIARQHIQNLGAEKHIHCENKPLERFSPPPPPGLVVVNPPYGVRLKKAVEESLKQLGQWLIGKAKGYTALVLTYEKAHGFLLGLREDRSWQLYNGELPVRLQRFVLNETSVLKKAEGMDFAVPQSAQMLANRLLKNQRKLKNWLKREGIEAYRLYDADLPEYAFAIDVYKDHFHLAEYKAPASIPEAKAKRRLEEGVLAIQAAFKMPRSHIHVKTRQKQKGADQYRKHDAKSTQLVVREYRCRYKVDLDRYLDTGLFLDHRWVRKQMQDSWAAGTKMLNLFCYTATVSVAAARGGARQTHSVDTSRTYLNWGRENFELNDLYGPQHRLIRQDSFDYVINCTERYDLIFVDPPTYSNSHSRERDWDVQRDHKGFLLASRRLLNPGGRIVFSTNFRKFKLDESLHAHFRIEDVTEQSIPPDFRNRKIHYCYILTPISK